MELVILVVVVALLEYIWFSFKVGKARMTYQIKAPAISGHPVFERTYRVQMNTLEQLVVFVPAILMFSWLAEAHGLPGNEIAAGFGVVWIIGRALYSRSYINDPAARGPGFMLTLIPSVVMLVWTLVLILLAVI